MLPKYAVDSVWTENMYLGKIYTMNYLVQAFAHFVNFMQTHLRKWRLLANNN